MGESFREAENVLSSTMESTAVAGSAARWTQDRTWKTTLGHFGAENHELLSVTLLFHAKGKKRQMWRPCWGWKNMGELLPLFF